MDLVITAVHIIACLALIVIVLLQHGKGASLGAAFGGSSQTLFGSSGATPFLGKVTTVVAVVFMLTSLSLAFFAGPRGGGTSVVDETPAQEAPAQAGQTADQEGQAGPKQ
ncbi:MAG: preprotein translocase subunit SecG [Deltaproteobacteria bacterium]|nr:preprotein translocase subunit SecG [Deltaproteobacteria bacterium]